jgi:LuxR family transcriptional regulator
MEYWSMSQLETADSKKLTEEIFEDFKLSATQVGFTRCSILMLPTFGSTSPPVLSMNNWPEYWNQHFQLNYGYRNNPVIEHCHRSLLPVLWTQILFDSIPGLWEDLCHFGLQYGFSQSVHDHHGLTSIFCFAQDERAITPNELYERMGVMLWLITRTHMRLIDQLLTTVRPLRMSERELEVLKWTAQGKTSHEVATILSISERTVNFHVQSIIHKLEVKNKIEAVVAAIKRKLI